MSIFNVELKKVVDDTYDIEIGYELMNQLVKDIDTGLVGKVKKCMKNTLKGKKL